LAVGLAATNAAGRRVGSVLRRLQGGATGRRLALFCGPRGPPPSNKKIVCAAQDHCRDAAKTQAPVKNSRIRPAQTSAAADTLDRPDRDPRQTTELRRVTVPDAKGEAVRADDAYQSLLAEERLRRIAG